MSPILFPNPDSFDRAIHLVELRAIAKRAAADLRLQLALREIEVDDSRQAHFDEREWTQLATSCERELRAIANAALEGSWT